MKFHLSKHNTDVKTEFLGGLTTFLTMVYIIFVHPSILAEAGMEREALITVTCLVVVISSLLVGLWANLPFALAPGMGLNAFFTYTLVLGEGIAWQTALGIVFISGVLFLLVSLLGLSEKIVDAIPRSLRLAAGAGIGLFIAFIGMRKMGLIEDDPATLVRLGTMDEPLLLALGALLIMAVLDQLQVKGAIMWGIVAGMVGAAFFGELDLPETVISMPPSIKPITMQLDVLAALKWTLLPVIFTFLFIDMFDSIGTVLACSYEAGMIKNDEKLEEMPAVLKADAMATIIGSVLGSSTTTTYIESASGIASGARTGLSSVFVAIFFLLALFFSPLIAVVPDSVVAPALVLVGAYMFKLIRLLPFENLIDIVPAFLTIILMPLTYSISTGLAFGFISYAAIALMSGQYRSVSPLLWIVAIGAILMVAFH